MPHEELHATPGADRCRRLDLAVVLVGAGFDMVSVIGLYGRADTPEPVVRKIADEAIAVMRDPEMKPTLAALGMEPLGEGPDKFAKLIAAEIATITRVVESVGIKPR